MQSMRRHAQIAAVLIATVLLATVTPAPGVVAGAAAAESAAKPPPDQSVTLSTVALPIVSEGQVVNYVFVTVKLLLTPSADVIALRDKEPYFRDALVRAAHRTPFVRPGDLNRIDEARLKATMLREAGAITGPGKIQGVAITVQSPQHILANPRPTGGAAIVP